jgi:signal transduction histidine kinase
MTAVTPASSGDGRAGARDRFGFALSGGVEAAAAARRAVIAGDGLVPACVREDVLLLMTELVTNAVRHAGVGAERPVRVEVTRLSRRVRVEVIDRGPGFDHRQAKPASNGGGGWGLLLVERIADRWGIASATGSTRVWFELRVEA